LLPLVWFLPALRLPPAVPSDERLFALERQLLAAQAKADEACDRHCEAEQRQFDLMPNRPERKPPKEYFELYRSITSASSAGSRMTTPSRSGIERSMKPTRLSCAPITPNMERLSELTGVDATDAEYQERHDEMWRLRKRFATRGRTLWQASWSRSEWSNR
jgi:hypothetical protein